jgi:hypothetical protein
MATRKNTPKPVRRKAVPASHTMKKTLPPKAKKTARKSDSGKEDAAENRTVKTETVVKKPAAMSPREKKIQNIKLILLHQKDALLNEAEVAFLYEVHEGA